MAEPSTSQALGLAFASGAVMTILLDELVNKKLLSVGDVRGVLQQAQNGLVNFYGLDIGRDAGRAITELLARFPESRT